MADEESPLPSDLAEDDPVDMEVVEEVLVSPELDLNLEDPLEKSLLLRHEYDFPLQKRKHKEAVVRWISITDGTLPPEPSEPYMADNRRFEGKFHYIARYRTSDMQSTISPFVGPLVRDKTGYELLLVPGGGKTEVTSIKNYEVLVVSKKAVCWNPLSLDGSLPQRPVPGILREGGNIYIGKMDYVGVGMVRKDDCWLFYSHRSTEPFTEDFKVLCFVSNV